MLRLRPAIIIGKQQGLCISILIGRCEDQYTATVINRQGCLYIAFIIGIHVDLYIGLIISRSGGT
jgi:hypothetical protein